jgi:glycerophosphoryl diester phosphodiesterase
MKRFLFGALLLAACSNYRHKQTAMPDTFDKQGHRGCRGLMPENTIAAMYSAIDLGVTTLEMDVVITADRQVLVSHEPWMGHEIATKPDGSVVTEVEERQLNIYKMTVAEAQRYDVGLKPHPRFPQQEKIAAVKPLLSALIDSVKNYCSERRIAVPYFNIEIKSLPVGDGVYHPAPNEFARLVMEVILDKKLEKHTIIQSFDMRSLNAVHTGWPKMVTALLMEDTDTRTIKKQLTDLGYKPEIYSPHYKLVTPEVIRYCHSKKIKVIPWTVNTQQEMTRLISLGVDGVISDYPNLIPTVIKKLPKLALKPGFKGG